MKRLVLIFRRAQVFMLALGVLGLVVVALSTWRSSALQADKRAEAKRRFHERIRDGVGREVQFALPGDPSGVIRASVNSVDNFIFNRSGIKLSGPTKNRIAEMEERTLNGESRRVSVSELSDVITAIALERLSTLSEQEIFHLDDSLRGLNDPELPESFKRTRKAHIKLRASQVQVMNSEEFIAQVKALKAQIGSPGGDVFSGMARNAIAIAVKDKVRVLTEATPEKFAGSSGPGSNGQVATGITPLRAVLLMYSVASDDQLADSGSNLKKSMISMQEALAARFGRYPGEEGHFAFGVNGFIYSTPLDLVFDERTLNSLLNRLEERMTS